MKTACTVLLGLLLSICLTLYGPFGMVRAGDGAVFSMEICADGIAKTVLFDADGKPVEPTADCAECLTCCQAIGFLVPENCSATSSLVLAALVLETLSTPNSIPIKRHTFPAPRGPPVAQVSMVTKSGPILDDQSELGQIMRSDGRLLPKDAFA
tara:strand:- start:49 stop:510 length:462 start_codon:yes stop_codon:yes gene_type:complete